MSINRIHYLESNDLMIFEELNKSIDVLNAETEIDVINDAIERYIIDIYLNNRNYYKFFEENLNDKIDDKRKSNKKLYSRYFNKITSENFLDVAKSVYVGYNSKFLEACVQYKIFKRMTAKKFLEILNFNQYYLSIILEHKKLVDYLNEYLRKQIINNIDIVELLVHHENRHLVKKIYLPESLSDEDINLMVKNYLMSDYANINTLENIFSLKSNKINITEQNKFLAKKRHEDKLKDIFQDNSTSTHKWRYIVKLSDELNSENLFEFKIEDNKYIYSFNKNVLENNLEVDEIVGVITYLLCLVDRQFRIVGLNNKNKISAIEKVFLNPNRNSYNPGVIFNSLNTLVHFIVLYYVDFLKRHDIRIEQVMNYFFNEYLSEKFNVKNFMFNEPSKNINLKEKIKLLATELDSVVKQYHLMNDDRVINHDFINFTSNVPDYRSIKSRLDVKNVYFDSEVSEFAINSLLNDQYNLYYYDVKNKITLESAILNNNAYFSKMEKYQQPIFKYLIEKNFFMLKNDRMRFQSYDRYVIYKDLYMHDFISYYNKPKILQKVINKEIINRHLSTDGNLLSRHEADLFDYYLTDKFSDSLGVRNRYIHGITETDEYILARDYNILVRLFLSFMIKIDDELCIEDSLKNI